MDSDRIRQLRGAVELVDAAFGAAVRAAATTQQTITRQVYARTASMPADERFGLTMQMRRCAVSVPSNIAEGHARQSRPDYLKHLRIARGSLAELITQVELCRMLSFSSDLQGAMPLAEETDRVLQGLIRALEAKQ